MNICEKKKTILFHNPKTGGQFIRRQLDRHGLSANAYEFWGPYNREINTDLGHINRFTIGRYFAEYRQYQLMTFVRNPYNRFISAMSTARGNHTRMAAILHKYPDPLTFLHYLDHLNYYEQDRILRSPEVPWFNPQSYYVGEGISILRYESEEDWQTICRIFDISETQVRIKSDYPFNQEAYDILRRLYFDDAEIFEMYFAEKGT